MKAEAEERATGSDRGCVPNRKTYGAGGVGSGRGLGHAMQTHERSHTHTVSPTVPDSNAGSQWVPEGWLSKAAGGGCEK